MTKLGDRGSRRGREEMVAMGAEEEEERRIHQGCMAGFLHLFDRPQILSGKRLYHPPRRLLSSSSGSATPSEKSMPLERETPLPSPDTTPPAAPRPSLQLPPLDLKNGGAGGAPASWRLPRLSLDSRAVVDARGKLRPLEIQTSPVAAPPSPGMAGDDRRSPSVVARLMGLDALPRCPAVEGQHAPCGGELRRSASERVPRDPSHFRFVDPTLFEKPAPPVLPPKRPSSQAPEAARLRAPDPACPRLALQRRSRFDAGEMFPEPAKRVESTAGDGEIALYGEIERRLLKRGIAEPARDLETMKQILEALQLKGLLHHNPPPVSSVRNPPSPIVVMRPSTRPPQPPSSRTTPARRVRVDVDHARRPRSPDRAASPARSPVSPARCGPQSPQRRISPAQSPKHHLSVKKPGNAEATGVRSHIARRAARNTAALSPDDDASTTFSDGGSSSSFSASSRWDFEQRARSDRGLLERCGKLLSSIQAFTAGDAAADQQPSPVSVLDPAVFLADEDSPSSSASKRAIDFGAPSPRPATEFDPEDDEWVPEAWLVGPDASDPDYAYVAEVVRLFHRVRDPDDVYNAAETNRQRGPDTWQHRRLLCGAAAEAMDRWRSACPWEPVAWLRGGELLERVWTEVQCAREPVALAAEDPNDLTRGAILRDLSADRRWSLPAAEVADAVLQIERLVFKDLVANTIRELADVDGRLPRRKLVF